MSDTRQSAIEYKLRSAMYGHSLAPGELQQFPETFMSRPFNDRNLLQFLVTGTEGLDDWNQTIDLVRVVVASIASVIVGS
jgi:hypothetical protein